MGECCCLPAAEWQQPNLKSSLAERLKGGRRPGAARSLRVESVATLAVTGQAVQQPVSGVGRESVESWQQKLPLTRPLESSVQAPRTRRGLTHKSPGLDGQALFTMRAKWERHLNQIQCRKMLCLCFSSARPADDAFTRS